MIYKIKDIDNRCFHVKEGKTRAAARAIPIHPLIEPIIENLKDSSKDEYLIRGIKSGGYDNKRSWNFQKKLTRLRQKLGMPEGVNFHTLRKTFATRMENLGILRNHISQLEDSNMALDEYSSGIVIEGLVESINKLTYEEVDPFIKDTLKNSN